MAQDVITAVEAVSWIAFQDFKEIQNHLHYRLRDASYEHNKRLSFFVDVLKRNSSWPTKEQLPWFRNGVYRFYIAREVLELEIQKSGKTIDEFQNALLIDPNEMQLARKKINDACSKLLTMLRDGLGIKGVSNKGDRGVDPIPQRFLERRDIALDLERKELGPPRPNQIDRYINGTPEEENNSTERWHDLRIKKVEFVKCLERMTTPSADQIPQYVVDAALSFGKSTAEKLRLHLYDKFPQHREKLDTRFKWVRELRKMPELKGKPGNAPGSTRKKKSIVSASPPSPMAKSA